MSKLVTIYGGSGFVGRYIAQQIAQNGWRVRVAVRRPNEAMHVKPYGVVGQVEPVFCNIRDDASVNAVMQGADAVINCVGTFDRTGRNNFDAVQHVGAERIARLAAANGVACMVHISAIGADAEAESLYQQSKAQGEAAILRHMPDAVILRPSVIFGVEDGFFNRFAAMSRFTPVLPLVGAESKFQLVYVDDVARAAVAGATGEAAGGIYELGGPDVHTFREWMDIMLGVIHRRKVLMNVPFWIARMKAWGLDMFQMLTLGLFTNTILTRDQVKTLRHDNIVGEGAMTLADMGIRPVAAASILPDYLWRFRPSGQYDAIKESAKNLRKT